MLFSRGIAALEATFKRRDCRRGEKVFPFSGKRCDIDFPAEWKVFSHSREKIGSLCREIHGGIHLD